MAVDTGVTFARPHRPTVIRLLNWAGRQLQSCGLYPDRLTEKSILAAARREAGHADFGDESFLVPLRILIESLREDSRLNPLGRMMLRRRLVMQAANRLKVQADLARHPEILAAPIRRPLYVLGLPRTGTTLLYNLLAQDPAGRPLLTWESFCPSPPPEPETRTSDPRIKQARLAWKLMNWLAPELPSVHAWSPEGPAECLFLTFNTFVSPGFPMLAYMPRYVEWLRQLEFERRVSAYREYKQYLQLLQWRYPTEHWILKSPVHIAALDALLEVLPDACVVQTHRDPAKVVPSLCSLVGLLRGLASDEIGLQALGAEFTEHCRILVENAMEVRSKLPERILDVQYVDLIRDPLATVQRIYEHFGYVLDERMEEGMRRWLAEHPRNKKGVHRYDLQQFGLQRAEIDKLFAAYCAEYGIEREHGSPAG